MAENNIKFYQKSDVKNSNMLSENKNVLSKNINMLSKNINILPGYKVDIIW